MNWRRSLHSISSPLFIHPSPSCYFTIVGIWTLCTRYFSKKPCIHLRLLQRYFETSFTFRFIWLLVQYRWRSFNPRTSFLKLLFWYNCFSGEHRSSQSQLQTPQVESHFCSYKNIMDLIRDILDPKVLLALDSLKKRGRRKELTSFKESDMVQPPHQEW